MDHWLQVRELCHEQVDSQEILTENLDANTADPLTFQAHLAGSQVLGQWRFTLQPATEDLRWANQFGALQPSLSAYWLIRCDKQIIRGHNDVWSETAMEVYAALYRLVVWAREHSRSKQVLHDYWNSTS